MGRLRPVKMDREQEVLVRVCIEEGRCRAIERTEVLSKIRSINHNRSVNSCRSHPLNGGSILVDELGCGDGRISDLVADVDEQVFLMGLNDLEDVGTAPVIHEFR